MIFRISKNPKIGRLHLFVFSLTSIPLAAPYYKIPNLHRPWTRRCTNKLDLLATSCSDACASSLSNSTRCQLWLSAARVDWRTEGENMSLPADSLLCCGQRHEGPGEASRKRRRGEGRGCLAPTRTSFTGSWVELLC